MNKKKLIILLVVLAVVMIAAWVLYQRLSVEYYGDGEIGGSVDSGISADLQGDGNAAAADGAADGTSDLTMAPDFTMVDMDGNPVKLSDFRGKPVIINFWASWCPPCRSELPAFDAAYAKYGNQINFLMVNLTDGKRDTVGGVKRFVKDNGYRFPVYLDTGSNGANAYAAYSIPMTVLVDADGMRLDTRVGAMSEDVLQGYIEKLLGQDDERE